MSNKIIFGGKTQTKQFDFNGKKVKKIIWVETGKECILASPSITYNFKFSGNEDDRRHRWNSIILEFNGVAHELLPQRHLMYGEEATITVSGITARFTCDDGTITMISLTKNGITKTLNTSDDRFSVSWP